MKIYNAKTMMVCVCVYLRLSIRMLLHENNVPRVFAKCQLDTQCASYCLAARYFGWKYFVTINWMKFNTIVGKNARNKSRVHMLIRKKNCLIITIKTNKIRLHLLGWQQTNAPNRPNLVFFRLFFSFRQRFF